MAAGLDEHTRWKFFQINKKYSDQIRKEQWELITSLPREQYDKLLQICYEYLLGEESK